MKKKEMKLIPLESLLTFLLRWHRRDQKRKRAAEDGGEAVASDFYEVLAQLMEKSEAMKHYETFQAWLIIK